MKLQWTPEILIALIIVIGCFVLIACHIDSDVKSILGMAAAWAIRSSLTSSNK